MGSSYGGLAAAYIAFTYPGIFGKVFSQTGWFRWRPKTILSITGWQAAGHCAEGACAILAQVGNLEVAQMADRANNWRATNIYGTRSRPGLFCVLSRVQRRHDASSLEYPWPKP
jgi:enterochelin esterase-like enzyme